MHDATQQMNQKTGAMADKMDKTNAGVEKTGQTAADTKNGLTTGAALDARNSAITAMRNTKDILGKLEYAATYMHALEFQMWSPRYQSEEERQTMFDEAAREFIKLAGSMIQDHNDFSPLSENDEMNNLYALVTAAHEISEAQKKNAKDFGFKTVSLFDLMSEALDNDTKIKRSELKEDEQPAFSKTFLSNGSADLVYFMRVRGNFLVGLEVVKLTRKDNGNQSFNEKHRGLIHRLDNSDILKFIGLDMSNLVREWVPTLDPRTLSEIKYYSFILDRAKTTRETLIRNNIDPMMDSVVYETLRLADLSKIGMNAKKNESSYETELRMAKITLKENIISTGNSIDDKRVDWIRSGKSISDYVAAPAKTYEKIASEQRKKLFFSKDKTQVKSSVIK